MSESGVALEDDVENYLKQNFVPYYRNFVMMNYVTNSPDVEFDFIIPNGIIEVKSGKLSNRNKLKEY